MNARLNPVDAVALGYVLTHAREVGLPMPVDVHLGVSVTSLGGPAGVRFDMATLIDLCEWALYLEEPVLAESLTSTVEHHSVEGSVLELPVRLITTVSYEPAVLEQPVPYLVAVPDACDEQAGAGS